MHLGFSNVLAPCPTFPPPQRNSKLEFAELPRACNIPRLSKCRLLLLMPLLTAGFYKNERDVEIFSFILPARREEPVSRNRATCRKAVRRSGTIAPRTCQKGLVAFALGSGLEGGKGKFATLTHTHPKLIMR